MDATEYIQLRHKITSQCEDDLAALDRVWALTNPNENPPKASCGELSREANALNVPLESSSLPTKSTISPKTITSAMEKALDAVSGTFSWKEVRLMANGQGASLKKSTLSQFLRRKVRAGKIVVVREGAGRRPITFKKAEN